jgi:ATP-dependent Clp protease protease subunit
MIRGLKRFLMVGAAMVMGLFLASSGYSRTITLTPENSLVLRGEVRSQNMADLTHKVMSGKQDKLYLFIDSPGGSIFAGLKLVDALRATDKRIVCVANTAISMAFVIFQACDERLIMDDAILMQHVASYGLDGQEPNNFTFANFLHRMTQRMNHMQAQRMGMTDEAFYSKIRDDWWMWGDEAVKNKAADQVVDVKCSKELINSYTTETFQVFIFTIKLKFSNCPLIPFPVGVGGEPEESKKTEQYKAEFQKILDSFNPKSTVEKRFLTPIR